MTSIRVLHTEPEADPPHPVAAADDVEVVTASSLEEAENLLREESFDVVVTEIQVEDGTGFDLVRRVREIQPDTACVFYTDADLDEVTSEDGKLVTEFVPRDAKDSGERLERILRTSAENRSQTAYPFGDEGSRLKLAEAVDADSSRLRNELGRVAELARRHYDADVVTISVIGEREQRFLAAEGLDADSTPRQEAICNYTLMEDDVTVVEDARHHSWCDGMTAVHELGLRFYAGCPVKPDGEEATGTLCVYDDEPRDFTHEDEGYLRLLAEDAASKIETYGLGDGGG